MNQVASTAATPDPDPTTTTAPRTPRTPAPRSSRRRRRRTGLPSRLTSPSPATRRHSLWVSSRRPTPTTARRSRSPGPPPGPTDGAGGDGGLGGASSTGRSGLRRSRQFTYEVCDNGEPTLCDTGTVTLEMFPVAIDDQPTTFADTPVSIPVAANDVPGGVVDLPTRPDDGTAVAAPQRSDPVHARAGFTGTDTFPYSYCSPDPPPLCVRPRSASTCCRSTPPPSSTRPTVTTTTARRSPAA